MDPLHISCPRCSGSADVRYYGPCDRCRTDLRRTIAGEAREVSEEGFVPAMHVTPNAVATKD